jgi:hypothetical protein
MDLNSFGENEEEVAAIAYGVLKLYSQQERPYAICVPQGDFDKMLDQFRSLYLESFYEYVDDHLDDPRFNTCHTDSVQTRMRMVLARRFVCVMEFRYPKG